METALVVTLINGDVFNITNTHISGFLDRVTNVDSYIEVIANNTEAKYKVTYINPKYILTVREISEDQFGAQIKTWKLT